MNTSTHISTHVQGILVISFTVKHIYNEPLGQKILYLV